MRSLSSAVDLSPPVLRSSDKGLWRGLALLRRFLRGLAWSCLGALGRALPWRGDWALCAAFLPGRLLPLTLAPCFLLQAPAAGTAPCAGPCAGPSPGPSPALSFGAGGI